MRQITNCILSWILSDSHTRNIPNEFDQNFDEHTAEIKSIFWPFFYGQDPSLQLIGGEFGPAI